MASDPESMAAQRAVVTDFTIERVFFHPTGIEVDEENRIQIYQKELGHSRTS
ncbi:MAG: hypothetical protein ACE5Q6_12960 [Dehalococcoidia bacterium]